MAINATGSKVSPSNTATLTGIASTTSLNFALLNDLLPSAKDVGKAMAFVAVGGHVFGMVAPIATGYVIAATGSYDWSFGIAGILLVVGVCITVTMTRHSMLAKYSNRINIFRGSNCFPECF